jgi:hypothetical protein
VDLFNRAGGASVVVSPGIVTARQTVQATVTTDKPIDEVRSARLDWGYTNFYQYQGAGRVDSADDWVSVLAEDVPISAGEFTGASSTFRIPSWAPASSPAIARWECRLTIDRGSKSANHDRDTRGEFTVVIGTADVEAYTEPLEVVSGAVETVIAITLSSPVYRAGETITGQATLTPTTDLPDGDLAVSWQRERESHPLTRAPGPGDQLEGRIIQLGNRIPLRAGATVVLPFEIPLPADAPPTAAAVHSSIDWFVQARLTYAGLDANALERVRRPMIVVNAP